MFYLCDVPKIKPFKKTTRMVSMHSQSWLETASHIFWLSKKLCSP